VPPTFAAYIDEAGDEGLSSSSPDCPSWFVLAAVVMPKCHEAPLIETLREFREDRGMKSKMPIHFSRLRHPEERRMLIERLAGLHSLFRAVTVFVHKPSIQNPESFQRGRLYFYYSRYLLERISWFCRSTRCYENRALGDGTVEITFSKRKDMRYGDFCDYVRRLRDCETTRIDWSVVSPDQIGANSSGRLAGLQIADSIASSFNCAVYGGPNHTNEWVRLLKPAIYRHRNRYRSYGLKFAPLEAEKQIAQGRLVPWANEIYQF
jgi:hypothetical protein